MTILAAALAVPAGAQNPDALMDGGAAAEQEKAAAEQEKTAAQEKTVTAEELADMLEADAKALLGAPYSYGARGPKAFDCSGFTGYVYGRYGITLGRSSRDQANDGRAVEGDLSKLQKGDLLIFGGRRSSIGHVGMFLHMDPGGRSGTFIHSARGGVQISHTNEPYYAARFRGARRIIPDFVKNPEGECGFSDSEFENVVFRPDTLTLGADDRRIILLSDGSWLLVDGDGRMSRPAADSSFVLGSNGRWKSVAKSPVTIPGTARPAAAGQTESAEAPSVTDTTGTADAASDNRQKPETVNEAAQVQQPVYHTVRQGDTLYRIATANHTSVKAICALNGIKETTILQIGRKLRIK